MKACAGILVLLPLLLLPHELPASEEEKDLEGIESPPILRFLVAGNAAASAMNVGDEGVSWSYAVGAAMEMSLAGKGLTPVFQAGYFVPNAQWHHALPIDIGGRYVWQRQRVFAYLSGGMSIFVYDQKIEDSAGKADHNWEVTPLIYVDLGCRYMFRKHVGLEVRLDFKTYAVINVIGLKLGLAI